jgi:putative colanic acid biosynthesis acetyltransferase WcaF
MNDKMQTADLSSFTSNIFDKGASTLKQLLWYFVNACLVRASWNPFMTIKVFLLKVFGAKIGKKLVIKNNVTIKFPWKLSIGDNVWLGENCWIDNLDNVTIGNNVCISQGALLLTGNHDYTKSSFDYRNAPIVLEEGVWIGAKSVVCPGVTCYTHSILTVDSVATKNLEAYTIYQGNPAVAIRKREIHT